MKTEEKAIKRFRDKVKINTKTGCHIWNGARDHRRYGEFWDGKRMVKAHRYAFEKHHGLKIPSGHEIHHLCRNRSCVNPRHLALVTHKANMKLAAQAGAWSGERNPNAKLTDLEALEARVFFDLGEPVKEIAERFGVAPRTIYSVIEGSSWKDVQLPKDLPQWTPERSLATLQRVFTGLMRLLTIYLREGLPLPEGILRTVQRLTPLVRLPQKMENEVLTVLDKRLDMRMEETASFKADLAARTTVGGWTLISE